MRFLRGVLLVIIIIFGPGCVQGGGSAAAPQSVPPVSSDTTALGPPAPQPFTVPVASPSPGGSPAAGPAVPTTLSFVAPPSSVSVDSAIDPSRTFTLRVELRDQFSQLVLIPATLSLELASGPGTLGGNRSANTLNGVATFSGLSLSAVGTVTLLVRGAGLQQTCALTVTAGVPTQLRYLSPPTNGTAGVSINPTVQVVLVDAQGNQVPTPAPVNVALASSASDATLSGKTAATDPNGVATFSSLQQTVAGTGYILTASSGALTPAVSNPFDVVAAGPNRLRYVTPPSASIVAGSTFQVAVAIVDQFGNRISTATNTVTVSITPGVDAPVGAYLVVGGATSASQPAVSGVATLTGLSHNKTGTYTLTASAAGFPALPSASYTVTGGVPTALAYLSQPTNGTAGVSLSPTVQVYLLDALGNRAPAPVPVNITLTSSANDGTLSGKTAATDATGLATFASLQQTVAATGYTLTATSGALTPAVSSSFDVVAAGANHLRYVTAPSATMVAGTNFQVAVALEDQFGNRLLTATNSVTVSITPGTDAPLGAYLVVGGATSASQAAVAGVATVTGLSHNKTGGYTLTASAGGCPNLPSSSYTVTPAAPSSFAWITQPPTACLTRGTISTVTVALQDGFGNAVPNSPQNVSLSVSGPGTLSGMTPVSTDAGGQASFSGLGLDQRGNCTLVPSYPTFGTGLASNNLEVDDMTYVAGGASNSIRQIRVQPTATLVSQGAAIAGGAGNAQRVIVHPNGRFLYAVEAGSGAGATVTTYAINQVSGALTFTASVACGNVPKSLTLTPDAQRLFVACQNQLEYHDVLADFTLGNAVTAAMPGDQAQDVLVHPTQGVVFWTLSGSQTVLTTDLNLVTQSSLSVTGSDVGQLTSTGPASLLYQVCSTSASVLAERVGVGGSLAAPTTTVTPGSSSTITFLNGYIYLGLNGSIAVYLANADGSLGLLQFAGGIASAPTGLTADRSSFVYVVETNRMVVFKQNGNGTINQVSNLSLPAGCLGVGCR